MGGREVQKIARACSVQGIVILGHTIIELGPQCSPNYKNHKNTALSHGIDLSNHYKADMTYSRTPE
jgi:hypothetical protein